MSNQESPQSDCIFCKIIAKQIPSEFIYEDDLCIAFKDINPKAKHHLLIVPKKHIGAVSDIEESNSALMGHLIFVAKKLGLEKNLAHYKLQFNVGRGAGQEVFHVHLHLMSDAG
ncbi:MAG: histidine triad (HIT) protein, Hit-like protein involved in cell-cycle regulation [Candidatus Peregrinibacteria bacterium GW2011_GWC2_39_14]|nr:MAG: Histidine triad (HIT) protein [Candidatus Peregrinibacteria bacterium GW2011_GWA2_38_36]KKR05185.1 MAG: histidine triad (HIT) protein, Hit-like protein involved in cell-cycle regulation [Candidatus Peregrinibacteria bacterium GW2011_GWC2_39_14]